ncbi:MAG: sulfurtransferase TusA, partial [Pseudohongiellaceae bacterium]|jgi:tRNA 2-thiouridine synthesizing protein A
MSQMSEDKTHILDARGLFCPEPVMLLHKKIREIASGEKVTVRATDPSTTRDIPKFCHFLGHELLESKNQDNEFFFVILKAGSSEDV